MLAHGRADGNVIDLGVGLWTMRSTARQPAGHAAVYRRLQEDARLAERLGFQSLWLAEHHFWYDGWCPSALTAAASVLGATSTLRAGTGVHLLSLWDVESERSAVETVMRLAGNRLELGVGLGYRRAEYEGFGLQFGSRARIMDAALDRLLAHRWPAAQRPPVMIGGFSDAALRRAARRGVGLLLPFSMNAPKVRATIERYREELAAAGQVAGRIGMLKYVCATDGSDRERQIERRMIIESAREYAGAWFPLGNRVGFEAPELLERQLELAAGNALIGPPEDIAEQIHELELLGVDLLVLQVTRDDLDVDYRRNMAILGERLLPLVHSQCA